MKWVVPVLFMGVLFLGCRDGKGLLLRKEAAKSGLLSVQESDYTAEVCRLILQDDEPADMLFNKEKRCFKVNEPLQIAITGRGKICFRFYSPRMIRDVVIWARAEGVEEAFKVAEFEFVPAFAEFSKPLPLTDEERYYLTKSGRMVWMGRHARVKDWKLEIVCEDPFYQKVVSTECGWEVSFGAYEGKNWTPLLPAHAREGVAIALNMSYLFSSGQFKSALEGYRGKLFCDNDGTTVNVDKLREQITQLPELVYGHVVGVNGLGGGNIFGLNEWCYLEHYADDKCETHTIFHEFSHCMGYNHTGNMTYENGLGKGWVSFCGELYAKMGIEKELPVYSRLFIGTREYAKRYGTDFYEVPKYKIELEGEVERGTPVLPER